MQRVPVLVLDDGSVICESVAICRYFEEVHPEPALFGRGAKGRAEVEMWNRRAELGLLFPVAQVFRHLHPAMTSLEVPQVAAWGEANRPKARRWRRSTRASPPRALSPGRIIRSPTSPRSSPSIS